MNELKMTITEYEVYERDINIPLFNKIISFINTTSSSNEKAIVIKDIAENCIWFKNYMGTEIQEEYQFEYLGELLERYEERIGNDIKDMRAIALAIGFAKRMIEKNMIMGTQLVDFINKVQNKAEDDMYFKGALFLYDNIKFVDYGKYFMEKEYKTTNDILFALSVMGDLSVEFLEHNQKQLIALLGNNRNIEVLGNIRIYGWFINKMYEWIKNYRKRGIELLKAFIKISTGYQKESTPCYKELIKNNYSAEEIAYLNYLLLYYTDVPNIVRKGRSIVEEKIAINLCIKLINSTDEYIDEIYEFISKLLKKYAKFQVKCYGYESMYEAIVNDIKISNPKMFLSLYEFLNEDIFDYDILDDKWDIVSDKFGETQFRNLFDRFLIKKGTDKEHINKCIEKYNQLTKLQYLEGFTTHYYERGAIFSFLVGKDVISLSEFAKKLIEENKDKQLNHLCNYIKGIRNRKSFDFLVYLLKSNKYNIEEINDFGFKFENLYESYSYGNIDICKEFLNNDEQVVLFRCLDNYVFKTSPTYYIQFLEQVIRCDDMEKIISKTDLKKIYTILIEVDSSIGKERYLQEKFLTTEEIDNIRTQEKMEQEVRELQEIKERNNRLTEGFYEKEKNAIRDIYGYCNEHWYSSEIKYSIDLSKEYLIKNISNFDKEKDNIKYFMKFLSLCVEKERMTIPEIVRMFCEYMKEEVKEYAINNGTYNADN